MPVVGRQTPCPCWNFKKVRPGGWLAVVLQLPKHDMEAVTASPFESPKSLKSSMRLAPTEAPTFQAHAEGLGCQSHETITRSSGKQFARLLFQGNARTRDRCLMSGPH